MVSALIPNKRVEFGIDAVSRIADAHLVIAGDGPLRKYDYDRGCEATAGQVYAVVSSGRANAEALPIGGRVFAMLEGRTVSACFSGSNGVRSSSSCA